ncbi:hypothetical protein DFH09DRAFT_1250430 [Mycena vulgaris]|nr:hypothetical protein DFH09DRAFT_1250430 [Mycena vulgaris]
MVDHGTPPVIPTDLLPYESYVEDPKWQLRFTAMWCAALGLAIVLAAPSAFRWRHLKKSLWGLGGVRVRGAYGAVPTDEAPAMSRERKQAGGKGRGSALTTAARVVGSARLWSLPGITLNIGQILVVAGYAVFALVCIVLKAPLMENSNRAGFIALAQLPPVFLFASKNSPLTALLLGPGVDYTKLNYIHRWSARFLTLGALVHGSLWINNHLVWHLPILSQQKESSGIAAVGCLCVIVLTSVAPVRRWCYSGFLVVHFLAFPAFFITLCYHTIYATPWIFPPIAFYAADVLLRVVRWRVIHVPEAAGGWRAGQHVQVRALLGARAWEAHPLSVCCAAPGVSCLRGPDNEPLGLLLAARACGDWSRALHTWAIAPADDWYDDDTYPTEKAVVADATDSKRADGPGDAAHAINEQDRERGVPAQAQKQLALPGREAHLILDGPYGGPTLYAGDYARVLLFAGGSGATFTLGVLDELVGRATLPLGAGGEEVRTTRVVWCWCVRSFGAINWFAPYLLQIATRAALPGSPIKLSIRIYVTCLCDPDAVPAIPGCVVTEARPHVDVMLAGLLGGGAADEDDEDGGKRKSEASSASASVEALPAKATPESKAVADAEKGDWLGEDVHGGGVAVIAAGPGGLIREAGNAVARANLSARGRRTGGVVFCAEAFTV